MTDEMATLEAEEQRDEADIIADGLTSQIKEMLSLHGIDDLTKADAEFKDFEKEFTEAFKDEDWPRILRAASKAGKLKAARLAEESRHMTPSQLFERGHADVARANPPEEKPQAPEKLEAIGIPTGFWSHAHDIEPVRRKRYRA